MASVAFGEVELAPATATVAFGEVSVEPVSADSVAFGEVELVPVFDPIVNSPIFVADGDGNLRPALLWVWIP